MTRLTTTRIAEVYCNSFCTLWHRPRLVLEDGPQFLCLLLHLLLTRKGSEKWSLEVDVWNDELSWKRSWQRVWGLERIKVKLGLPVIQTGSMQVLFLPSKEWGIFEIWFWCIDREMNIFLNNRSLFKVTFFWLMWLRLWLIRSHFGNSHMHYWNNIRFIISTNSADESGRYLWDKREQEIGWKHGWGVAALVTSFAMLISQQSKRLVWDNLSLLVVENQMLCWG